MSAALLLRSLDPTQTEAYGRALGSCLRPGDLVRFEGDLGAGKTTFCRGVGVGLGVEEPLNSPTYLLCKEYPTEQGPLLHLDGYFEHRLASLLGEGLIERIDGTSMVLVEWAERVAPWLPSEGLDLLFERELPADSATEADVEEDRCPRRIELRVHGEAARLLLSRFAEKLAEQGISVEPGEEAPR